MLKDILYNAAEAQASDLHIKSGLVPYIRHRDGSLRPVGDSPARKDQIISLIRILLEHNPQGRENFAAMFRTCIGEFDGSAVIPMDAPRKPVRIRLNAFFDRSGLSLAVRFLRDTIPTMSELGLPLIFQEERHQNEGLILFCGATGSGKTTAMYSMLDAINEEAYKHIITLDDPIEIVPEVKKCIISQREIHSHCLDFPSGLRSALREDPDVIVIGEMRDRQTIRTALQAAETGHLVLSTIHAASVDESLDRIVSYSPADEHVQLRNELASSFRAMLGCSLYKRKNGTGRVGAYSVLLRTPATAAVIRNGNMLELISYMNASNGMQSMETAVNDLIMRGLIEG